MDKAKIKQLINIVFLLCIFMYILLSLLKSFVKPNEIIEMENRYANKYDSISLKKYVNGTLQDNIENTLSDQVILSSRLKKGNNYIKGLSLKKYVDLYFKRHDLDYLNAGDVNFYGPENLVYYYRDLNNISQYLDKKIENYNSFASKNKDVNVYLYYIEKDTDINFKTGKKVDIFEYIQKRLNNIKASKFEIDNFEDFKEYFYKTDHHWNYKGSYKAYNEVLDLMNISNPVKFVDEICLNKSFSGSKASASVFNKIMKDDFCAYKFNFSNLDITVNGEKKDYGAQTEFFNNTTDLKITYGNFYGWDDGEVIFKNNNSDSKNNLLVIGESYDNAILKLLAEKYNTTISIDLRNYKYYMQKDFDFQYYKEKYNINKVLFIENVDFYVMDEFMVD